MFLFSTKCFNVREWIMCFKSPNHIKRKVVIQIVRDREALLLQGRVWAKKGAALMFHVCHEITVTNTPSRLPNNTSLVTCN